MRAGSAVPATYNSGITSAATLTKTLLRDLLEILVLALVFYFVATTAVETVHVVGWSMYPTLDSGDLLIASKLDYKVHAPERGDIVILKAPVDPSRDYIKRIIGLPGDRILIRDRKVYVGGTALDEPYLGGWATTANWPNPALGSNGATVPAHQYFVLGDNRDRSNDSRVFGFIDQDQIDGKAIARFWPATHLEVLNVKPTLARENS